jgi:hypothetical protein
VGAHIGLSLGDSLVDLKYPDGTPLKECAGAFALTGGDHDVP